MVFQSVQLTVQPDAITLEHTNVIVATMDMPSQQMDRVTVCSVEFHLISVGLTVSYLYFLVTQAYLFLLCCAVYRDKSLSIATYASSLCASMHRDIL